MPDVACLGILVADLVGRPIDALPERGRLGLVDRMELHIGGCAANTAMALARLGVNTAVLGKVGQDGLGEFITATLDRSGIDTRGIIHDPGVGTSTTMVLVGADGERTFLHYLGGNAEYHAADVYWPAIEESRLLHVAGALVMPSFDGAPMADTLQRAKSIGLVTSLDTVWDATGKWMATLAPCLSHADFFLPSLAEGRELTERSSPAEIAAVLRDAGVGTVGLKLGEDGCYIEGADGALTVPAYPVHMVDGTGCGDAWVAGFLCGVTRGWDLERTGQFANAVGGLCATAMGATAGIRSLDETEDFIANSK